MPVATRTSRSRRRRRRTRRPSFRSMGHRALQSARLHCSRRCGTPVSAQVSLWISRRSQRFDHIGAMLVWRTWGRVPPSRLQLKREHEIFFGACESAEAVASSPARRPTGFRCCSPSAGRVGGERARSGDAPALRAIAFDEATVVRQPLLRPCANFPRRSTRSARSTGITALVGSSSGWCSAIFGRASSAGRRGRPSSSNILGIGIVRELGRSSARSWSRDARVLRSPPSSG